MSGEEVFRRKQVKAARALLGWTGQKLAEKAGVSHPTVVNYETGRAHVGGKAVEIHKALEAAGVRFTKIGVELNHRRRDLSKMH